MNTPVRYKPGLRFEILILLCGLGLISGLEANEALDPRTDLYAPGSGSVFLRYQYIKVNKFQNGVSKVPIGEVLTQSLYLELEYAFAERWKFELGVPYIKKRYIGPGVHDPLKLVPPRPDVPLIDDGKYHSELQDFVLGVHYLWIDQPFRLEPFVYGFIPSHDYPFFGNAATGQNLWKVEFGLELTHFLPFSNWYYNARASYIVAEQTLSKSINHVLMGGEVGYFLSPRFSMNAFFLARKGKGDSAQAFPPGARTTEAWFQHDRTTRHNYLNVGFGADWFSSRNYQLSANLFTTIWGDSVHWVDVAGDVGLTRYF